MASGRLFNQSASWMIGVAGLGVGLALAYAAKRSGVGANLPPPREVMNELFARIHAEYAPSNKHKEGKGEQRAADRRTRVERLLDEDLEEEELEMNADYTYSASVYTQLPLASPTFPLPPPLAFHAFSYLDFVDLTLCIPVNKAWAAFTRTIRKDRTYLHGCAERGFGDGITGLMRGKIWQILCGADQLMASMAYANKGEQGVYWQLIDQIKGPSVSADMEVTKDVIAKDINRTIVHLDAFINRQEAAEALTNVLEAYAVSDPEVGYTQGKMHSPCTPQIAVSASRRQSYHPRRLSCDGVLRVHLCVCVRSFCSLDVAGLNFVAGYLLTKMPQDEAYWTLHALMFSFKYDLRRFYLPDLRGLLIFKYQFDALFKAYLPTLHQHFVNNNVYSDVMTEWFMSIFCFRGFPRPTLNRTSVHTLPTH